MATTPDSAALRSCCLRLLSGGCVCWPFPAPLALVFRVPATSKFSLQGCQTFRVISRVALMINRAAGVWRRWISMYLGIASDPKCNCNYTGWVSGTQGKGSEWPGLLSGLFYHNRSRGWPPRLLGLEKVLGGPALGHQAGLSLNSGTVTLFP